ncbi:hypothetical protein M8C21_000966 [Ambrosia artemisiifolia]|uniref:Uncharacterized protein n=1 Tax=Ambrosia artemisiifolia TaxID=4212 RepID=A0AAD5CCE5_AMBAR|nr:hypothetical protein M8C21_000966 [Ambrosia artemisiifolia]
MMVDDGGERWLVVVVNGGKWWWLKRLLKQIDGPEEKDSDAVKEALNQLSESGWAKKWSSQPYVSRRTVMQAAFLFTEVGTTGFLGLLAGQLPGVSSNYF